MDKGFCALREETLWDTMSVYRPPREVALSSVTYLIHNTVFALEDSVNERLLDVMAQEQHPRERLSARDTWVLTCLDAPRA
jgi:hypothetical protein